MLASVAALQVAVVDVELAGGSAILSAAGAIGGERGATAAAPPRLSTACAGMAAVGLDRLPQQRARRCQAREKTDQEPIEKEAD